MTDYQLTATDSTVIRNLDGAYIPNDPGNRDWVEYQQWLEAGGVPDPVPPKVVATLDSVGNARTAAQILGAT
jgi:hypothetical protein